MDRDEVTSYTSDANDRMLSESTVVDGVATESTAYGYTGTQQTSKTVSPASGSPVSAVSFSYNLQGRMSDVTSTTFNPTTGTATRIDTIGYRYGTDGIRISARQEIDTNADGNIDSVENTEYLIDANNHTGYQQVLQETVTDANGNLTRKIVYTIGLDHISQTTFTTGGPAQGSTAVFHMDGHGSTRILTDLVGTILNIGGFAQIYHYTAYGEPINFQMANAATQYLYSGEQFDPRIGQQYLRARYYNQANGTFNRLDPFFGNRTDPQSFHKYRYTHGDPIQFGDPTGLFEGLVGGFTSMASANTVDSMDAEAKTAVGLNLQSKLYSETAAYGARLAAKQIATEAARTGIRPLMNMMWTLMAVLTAAIVVRVREALFDVIEEAAADAGGGSSQPDSSPPDGSDGDDKDQFVYFPLDSQQRATGASAYMSAKSVGLPRSNFNVYPSWWDSSWRDNRGRPIERGHLIGSDIGGAGGAEYRNLVPMYLSVNRGGGPVVGLDRGMAGPEREVKNAALRGGKIMLFVAPIYNGSDNIPAGIEYWALGETLYLQELIINSPA
ncbi:MAG: DNA/RNA non-specific endonuclease [Planctomycetaceae bacterium]|nr:DNA/RNA non-specific endonuclease [Planctomycetaceae bacterium]